MEQGEKRMADKKVARGVRLQKEDDDRVAGDHLAEGGPTSPVKQNASTGLKTARTEGAGSHI